VTPLVTHMPVVVGLGDRATLLFGPPATGSLWPDQEVPPPADGSDISHERATRGEASHDQDHVPGTHLPLRNHWGGGGSPVILIAARVRERGEVVDYL
jgi:hypothetical protein